MAQLPMAYKMALGSVESAAESAEGATRPMDITIPASEVAAYAVGASTPRNPVEAMKSDDAPRRPKYAGVWLVEKQRARATVRPNALKRFVAKHLLGFTWVDAA